MSKTTDTIAGLRFQVYPESDEVHVHDDAKGIKVIASSKDFKEDVASAIKNLKSNDGATIIEGTSKEKLCLISCDGKIKAYVIDNKEDFSKEIESFLKTI
jgi:hypothetical protein